MEGKIFLTPITENFSAPTPPESKNPKAALLISITETLLPQTPPKLKNAKSHASHLYLRNALTTNASKAQNAESSASHLYHRKIYNSNAAKSKNAKSQASHPSPYSFSANNFARISVTFSLHSPIGTSTVSPVLRRRTSARPVSRKFLPSVTRTG